MDHSTCCPFCNSELTFDTHDVPIPFNGALFVVQNLPSERCNTCGQYFVEKNIADVVIALLEADQRAEHDVEVLKWKAA